MSHFRRTVIELIVVLLLIGTFGITMYYRGKRVGRAAQEGIERRSNVEKARETGDTEAIDREWER